MVHRCWWICSPTICRRVRPDAGHSRPCASAELSSTSPGCCASTPHPPRGASNLAVHHTHARRPADRQRRAAAPCSCLSCCTSSTACRRSSSSSRSSSRTARRRTRKSGTASRSCALGGAHTRRAPSQPGQHALLTQRPMFCLQRGPRARRWRGAPGRRQRGPGRGEARRGRPGACVAAAS